MFSRLRLSWSTTCLCVAIPVIAFTAVVIDADTRTRLDASTLARMRGGNQGFQLKSLDCNDGSVQAVPCTQIGSDCATCTGGTYNGMKSGTGAYTSMPNPQSCGDLNEETCDSNSECQAADDEPDGECEVPGRVVSQQ